MKLESFKFQDGKVLWLPEYPKKPKEPPRHWTATSRWEIYEEKTLPKYEEAVAKSLASAVEVAPEDAERIRNVVTGVESINGKWGPQVDRHGIQKDKVYSAECEMEISHKCLKTYDFGNYCDAPDCYESPDEHTGNCQVARLRLV